VDSSGNAQCYPHELSPRRQGFLIYVMIKFPATVCDLRVGKTYLHRFVREFVADSTDYVKVTLSLSTDEAEAVSKVNFSGERG
jgi:hypothetical protein